MTLRLSLNEITRYLTELFMLSDQMNPWKRKIIYLKRFSVWLFVVTLRIPCKQQVTILSLTFSILDISMIFLAETRTLCMTLVK